MKYTEIVSLGIYRFVHTDEKLWNGKLDLRIQKYDSDTKRYKDMYLLDNQEQLNQTYYDQIEKLHARIGDLRDENNRQHDEVKAVINQKLSGYGERITALEKWRWIVVGAILLAAFLFSTTNVVDWIQ